MLPPLRLALACVLLLPAAGGCAARTPVPERPERPSSAAVPGAPSAVLASSTALMPRAVTSFGAAELGGFVYAFGGYFGTPHAYSRDYQSGELWRLDPSAHTFELVASAEPTQGPALVSSEGALIRVGGMRANNPAGSAEEIVSIDEVASFTPGESSWSALPKLPAPRSSHAAAVLGDSLYVVGGWQLSGSAQAGKFADTMLAFDLKTKSYRALPQPFQLRALAAAVLDGKLLALGGLDAEANVSRAVHVFDPATESWSRTSDLPVDGFGIAATSTGDVLYASARDGTLYALSELSRPWQAVGTLAFPRFFHQLVAVGKERVLALGGISGMHVGPRIRQVEELDVARGGPNVFSFMLVNPLRGRNRQGVFVHGDALYVFGGNRSLAQHDFGPDDFLREAARLDLAALSWGEMAALPVARQSLQTVVEGDQVLVLGGFGHDGKEARAQRDAFHYDVERDAWASDPSVLPSPRTQFGLATENGTRWVFGGLDFQPEAEGEAQFAQPMSVLWAAPGEPFRDSGITLKQPRRAFGGAALDGRYYLVGGMAGTALVKGCEAFDFKGKSWLDLPCPKATRVSPQLVALNGKLYLAGGSSPVEGGGLAPNASIEVFDPETKSWSTLLERIPIEPHQLSMQPYAGGLLLYSAQDEAGRVQVALVKP